MSEQNNTAKIIALAKAANSDLKNDLTSKLDKPTTAGTANQVLVSDGNGGQVWGSIGSGEITVDNTLSISGAAADAAKTGELKSAVDDNLHIKIADGIYALDWIESDGTAYINSGVNPSSTLEFEIDFINWKTPSANPYANLIGSRIASKNNDFEISTYVTNGYSGTFRIGNENFNAYLKTGERQKVSYKNGKYNVDGTDYTVSNGISSNSYPIYIFSLNSAGVSTYPLNARIYSVKLWDSGSLVRDYIPAYKNATNEAGLYDKVNNAFYGKATGSAFTYQFTQRIEKEVSKIMDYNPPYKRMSIELEKGGYDTNGDLQEDTTGTRWRTKNFIYVSDIADTNIHVPVGFAMYVCQYSEGNTFITRGTWNSGSVHDVKSLYSIKWTIVKSSWTASTEEEANCVDIKQKPAWYNYLTSGVNNLYEYPDYFKTQLISVSSNFISDMLSVGADGDGFVFITDVHWNGNYKHSPNLIYYLKNKTNLNMILCGGDLIDRSTTSKSSQVTDMQNCIKAFKGIGIPFITAIGNHDRNSAGVSDSNLYLSENEVFSITQNPVNMMQLHYADIDSRTCFYFDKTATKTRYIFIDSGKNNIGTFDITNDEVTWVSNTIVATPSEYHIIIIVHSLGEYQSLNNPIGELNPFVYTSGATSLLSTLDGLLSSHKIEAVFAGHTHVDDNAVTTGGIPIVWTNSDALWQYHGMTQPSDGTVDSQCFDVVTMDYANKTIKLRRVGRGSDRTITYGS